MSDLITGEDLRELARGGEIITSGREDCVDGIKYDFRLSGRFLKARHGRPVKLCDFNASDKENFSVDPGETVFVLAEEELHLPPDMKAEFSQKRTLAHHGIQVLGGFCIDPGYEGRLIFGLYNFSSEPFVLEESRKLIAAQFYRLTEGEAAEFPKPTSLTDFPEELVHIVKGMRAVSTQSLEERVDKLSGEVEKLNEDLRSRRDFFQRLEDSIDKITRMAESTQRTLGDERNERRKTQGRHDELIAKHGKSIIKLDKLTSRHNLAIGIIGTVGGLILGAVLAVIFTKVLG